MANEQQKVQELMGTAPDLSQSVALAVLREFEGDVGRAARTVREMTMEYPHLAESVAVSNTDAVREQEELLRQFQEERAAALAQQRAEEQARRAEQEKQRAEAQETERLRLIQQAEEEQAARLELLEAKRKQMQRRQEEMEREQKELMAKLHEQQKREEQERLAKAAQTAAVGSGAPSQAVQDLTVSIQANKQARVEALIRQEVEERLRQDIEKEREELRRARAELESALQAVDSQQQQQAVQTGADAAAIEKRLEAQFERRFQEQMDQLRGALQTQVVQASTAKAPRVTICWSSAEGDGAGAGPSAEAQQAAAQELRAVIGETGVEAGEIRQVDVVNDPELAVFVREQLRARSLSVAYPVVSVMGTPVGGVAEVKAAIADGSWATLLEGGGAEAAAGGAAGAGAAGFADGTGEIVGEGVLDKCLNAAEYVASGIGSLLLLPVNIITYPFRGGSGELPKGPNDVDFDVIHTNWYWRNLRRKFRFYDAEFVRIHPVHKDIRGRHAYTAIESVVFNSDTNIVIRYNDGASPDFIQASAADCQAIVKTIEKKLGKPLTVWRAEDLDQL